MSAARPFRLARFGPPGVTSQSRGIPVAAYPGRVATDSDLIVAVDRQQTTLLLPLNAPDTSMTVLDPSSIAAYNLLSIDNEIVKTTGVAAGNVVPISRGFDGTAAATHLSGALVLGLVDAFHHNALVAEIKAIEQTLGPNLANISSGLPSVNVSSRYNFTPQFPGGSLGPGNNPITLSPVPLGVNGTDQDHYLYIDQGVGPAEPVKITGGSAVAGAPSGTIIVNCGPGGHTGAWRISSATAGIQEAAMTPDSTVLIPPGSYNIYATITPAQGVTIDGMQNVTTAAPYDNRGLHMLTNGIPAISLTHVGNTVKNVNLLFGTSPSYTVGGLAATAGSIGVKTATGNDQPFLSSVMCSGFYQGFNIGPPAVYGIKLTAYASVQDGFVMGAMGSGYMTNILASANGGNGFTLNGGAAVQWISIAAYSNQGWGMYIGDGTAFQINNVDFENDYLGGFSIGNLGVNSVIEDAIIQFEGTNSIRGTNTTAPAVQIRSTSTGAFLQLNDFQISNIQGNGLEINGGGALSMSNSMFYQCGAGAVAGHVYAILTNALSCKFVNCAVYYSPCSFQGTANSIVGCLFNVPTSIPQPAILFGAGATFTTFAQNRITLGNPGVAVSYTAGSTFLYGANQITGGTISGTPGYDVATSASPLLLQLPVPTVLTVTANTIAPTLPVHHVGAGLIKTITPAAGLTHAIDLIADAAFTTDTTGNIFTAPITAVIGQVYRAVFDAAVGKWYIR